MSRYGDHDGKSKTASAVDTEHYPEMNETPDHLRATHAAPTHSEIAQRAYELWMEEGCPANAAERNWREAEQQLENGGDSQNQLHALREKGGSVQP